MNNLVLRIITAIVGAAIMITGILWNTITCYLTMLVLAIILQVEFLNTVQHLKSGKKNYTEYVIVVLTGITLFVSTAGYNIMVAQPFIIFFFLFILFPCIIIYELFAGRENPFQNIGLNITSLVYVILPFSLLAFIGTNGDVSVYGVSGNEHQPWILLGYFFIVWSNDTFAYFTGKAFGKHKLFERISPNKTWEGFFGGMVAGFLCAYLLSRFVDPLTPANWLLIALIIAVFGTLGDLTESMLKRSLQIKDSSTALPGHGGFLDRFDATLIAAPFVFFYLLFCL